MIFVDTGAWYALAVPSDVDHRQAKSFLATIDEPLITTDYIVDELLTLSTVRGEKAKGIEWRHDVLEKGGVRLERVTETDFAEAIEVYEQFADKEWSFTDCTSFAVIKRLGIGRAFSFDHHFRQFGIIAVVP
jgi:predicted nucleic acid-binding protein